MFGICFGIACLLGLVIINRRSHSCGSHFDGGPRRHGPPPFGGFRGRFGRKVARRKIDRALRSIRATKEQSREVHETLGELFDELQPLKHGLRSAPLDIAEALREDEIHEELLDSVLKQQRESIGEIQSAVRRALTRLHGVLDSGQRAQLLSRLGRLAHFQAAVGPYR